MRRGEQLLDTQVYDNSWVTLSRRGRTYHAAVYNRETGETISEEYQVKKIPIGNIVGFGTIVGGFIAGGRTGGPSGWILWTLGNLMGIGIINMSRQSNELFDDGLVRQMMNQD